MPLMNPAAGLEYEKELKVLEAVGISRKNPKVEDEFLQIMESAGLSKEEVLGTIAQVMNQGANDSVKLTAAKTALQIYMHPAFVPRSEKDRAERPVINFNISGGDVKLQNILTPQMSQVEGY